MHLRQRKRLLAPPRVDSQRGRCEAPPAQVTALALRHICG
ncbi:hypothetical protein SLI_6370 [Streptomyces lividans 1326]|uniref:Uncharacterized protein n=1 Tax=Streptomyces lividans 1326 TaxID=1200984 RepID=A0A7U9DXU0_STRLI|nr:hypothetical protein SLI_6370 [Streptomyces lividans 1326]